ncbi:MAG: WD40 repeat domain-containing protein, partial [Planctomycetaceae bacterium]|nr:WD40 repeat domain-containing protein [Planctomycetaceae bacterium]
HETGELKHQNPLTTLRVDPTGRYVAAGAQDLDVQLWNLEDGNHFSLAGHNSWVRSIDFSADGKLMYTACWGGTVKIWDLSHEIPGMKRSFQAHQGAARWVRLSPDGKRIATSGNDLLVKLWNAESGELEQQFSGHDRHVYGVDFHPDGQHLVSQDLMGNVVVWDLNTNKKQRTIDASVMTGYDKKFAADMGGARDMQFSSDGALWASAGITKVVNSFAGIQDPIIVVFDWKTGETKRQLRAADKFKGVAWGVRFHPEGFTIGTGAEKGGKGEVWFYNDEQDTAFHTLAVKSAARALDLVGNDRLAVAHADGAVRLYRMTEKAIEADGNQDAAEPGKD